MKRMTDPGLIRKYFDDCPISDYFDFDITDYTSLVRFDSEEAILREGELPERLYYLIDGQAKLYLSHPNGRISLISFLTAPCFIGEMELLGAQTAANGVTAITPCICYSIDTVPCRDKLLKDVKFLQYLCTFLSRKAIENTGSYTRNQAYPLEVRLAGFILLTSVHGLYREKHTEASEYLGVTYRHLLYVLAGFVKRGILQKCTQGYKILDLHALQSIAKPLTDE